MDKFYQKNIIVISPRYFNYENEIVNELIRKGAFVTFIDDRIKNDFFNKVIFRIKHLNFIKKKKIFNYFNSFLIQLKNVKVDYVLAIIPEGFSKDIVQHYRKSLPSAKFILYMWDSIENRPYISDMLPFFDISLTFDRSNSEKYSILFRPLFFTQEYGMISKSIDNRKYEISFIGTAHSDRVQVIKKIAQFSKNKSFLFFYLQNPLLVIYYYLTDKNFREVKFSDISYKGLSKESVLDIIKHSKCIVDLNHPKQIGLTIRTIEMLGASRKLITTNNDILNYDFYNPLNILVIDRKNPIVPIEFLNSEYDKIDELIANKYSLSTWVDDVFL